MNALQGFWRCADGKSLDRTSMQYAAFNPIQAAMGTGLSALGLYRGLGWWWRRRYVPVEYIRAD